jgi:hypothetical protein
MSKYIVRKEIAPFLREHLGIPISTSTVDKLCAPSVNQGPPVATWMGGRPLYHPDEVLAWGEARLSPKRPSAEQNAAA